MKKIFVLYDSQCGLCSNARSWMLAQPAHLAIEFVAAGSDHARRLFPELAHDELPNDVVVVSDEGEVFYGDAAWIMCLFALVGYRTLSRRLARPLMRPLARHAWKALSSNRQQISTMLAMTSDAALAADLQSQDGAECKVEDKV